MKQPSAVTICVLMLLSSCGTLPVQLTPTVTATSSVTPTNTPTHRPEPPKPTEIVLPPGVTMEFGEGATEDQKAELKASLAQTFELYRQKGFGEPGGEVHIFVGQGEELVNKSYDAFNQFWPMTKSEYTNMAWSDLSSTGGNHFMEGSTGYIFVNLQYGWWDYRQYGGQNTPTMLQCIIPNEVGHLFQQWRGGINFIDSGSGRRNAELGPEWIKIGKEALLCGYIYNVSPVLIKAKVVDDMARVPLSVSLQSVAYGNASEDMQHLGGAGLYFLLEESPGGKRLGPMGSLAAYFRGVADPHATWQEVFAETWGWTLEEFYKEFEARR